MLLGHELLELIGTLDDPETAPDDADVPDDAPPSTDVSAIRRRAAGEVSGGGRS